MILLNSSKWFWVSLLETKLLSGIDTFSIVFNKIIQKLIWCSKIPNTQGRCACHKVKDGFAGHEAI